MKWLERQKRTGETELVGSLRSPLVAGLEETLGNGVTWPDPLAGWGRGGSSFREPRAKSRDLQNDVGEDGSIIWDTGRAEHPSVAGTGRVKESPGVFGKALSGKWHLCKAEQLYSRNYSNCDRKFLREASGRLRGIFAVWAGGKAHVLEKSWGEEAVGFGYVMHTQCKVAMACLPWKCFQHFSLLRKLNNMNVKYKTVYIAITSQEVAEVALNLGSTLF